MEKTEVDQCPRGGWLYRNQGIYSVTGAGPFTSGDVLLWSEPQDERAIREWLRRIKTCTP